MYKATDKYLEHKLEERRREYKKFGETVYLLEPNVKKSQGGLRDLHVLQWVGMARYRLPRFVSCLIGDSVPGRLPRVKEAREFLFRVRAFLHVRAGMAQEILTFDEQIWLAQQFGFRDRPICSPSNNSCSSITAIRWGCMRPRCDSWNDVDRYPVAALARWLPARDRSVLRLDRQALTVPAELRSQVLDRPALLLEAVRSGALAQAHRSTVLLEDIHRHAEMLSVEGFRATESVRRFCRSWPGLEQRGHWKPCIARICWKSWCRPSRACAD